MTSDVNVTALSQSKAAILLCQVEVEFVLSGSGPCGVIGPHECKDTLLIKQYLQDNL